MHAHLRSLDQLGLSRTVVVVLALLTSWRLDPAQAQSVTQVVVSGVIRTSTGDSIPGARVELSTNAFDVTVRSNIHGYFSARVPMGLVKLAIASIGYEGAQRTLSVAQADVHVEIQMNRIAQRLAESNVRAKWIGIRGIVGDSATMRPLAGVEISSGHRDVHVVTDSSGRFEIPLPKAEPTALRIRREGYQTRPVVLSMADSASNDIIVIMTRGVDPPPMKQNLVDLDHRLAWNDHNSVVQSHDELDRYKPRSLMDALLVNPAIVRKGMRLQSMMCLSIDGVPQVGAPLSMVPFADVELVELYGSDADQSHSLSGKWRRRDCGCNLELGGGCGWQIGRQFVMYVNVWTKSQH